MPRVDEEVKFWFFFWFFLGGGHKIYYRMGLRVMMNMRFLGFFRFF